MTDQLRSECGVPDVATSPSKLRVAKCEFKVPLHGSLLPILLRASHQIPEYFSSRRCRGQIFQRAYLHHFAHKAALPRYSLAQDQPAKSSAVRCASKAGRGAAALKPLYSSDFVNLSATWSLDLYGFTLTLADQRACNR